MSGLQLLQNIEEPLGQDIGSKHIRLHSHTQTQTLTDRGYKAKKYIQRKKQWNQSKEIYKEKQKKKKEKINLKKERKKERTNEKKTKTKKRI